MPTGAHLERRGKKGGARVRDREPWPRPPALWLGPSPAPEHEQVMEEPPAPQPQAFPRPLPGRLPVSGSRPAWAPAAASGPGASSTQGCLRLTPAPDCGLSRIQHRPAAQMVPFSGSRRASWKNHGASLPQSTFERREEGPFSPVAAGTWLPPREPPPAADPCGPCLQGWLLSDGPCGAVGGPRGGARLHQPLAEVSALSGFFWLPCQQ